MEAPEEYLELYPEVEDSDRRTYLAMVTAMDSAIGKVTSAMKNSALWEDAVVLFFSDNGGPKADWPPGILNTFSGNIRSRLLDTFFSWSLELSKLKLCLKIVNYINMGDSYFMVILQKH